MDIAELKLIDFLESLKSDYKNRFGSNPSFISYWDPSPQVKNALLPCLRLPQPPDPINYIFSYSSGRKERLLSHFGFLDSTTSLILPSGSSSILAVVNWLKHTGKNLTILTPAYFTLFHNCSNLEVPVKVIPIPREGEQFIIPDLELSADDALWVTNPIYCTSVHLDSGSNLQVLLEAASNGTHIIFDECLANPNRLLSSMFRQFKNITAIYSPHKYVCVNGIKFSMVVAPDGDEDFYDYWADILYGCLSTGNLIAVDHFLSRNFSSFEASFTVRINCAWDFLTETCKNTSVQLDLDAHGYLVTMYFPWLKSDLGLNQDFLRQTAYETGTTFIPGARNYFHDGCGLSIRVNLARDCPEFRGGVSRLINYLCSLR